MILVNPEKLSMPQQVQKNKVDIEQNSKDITELKTGYNQIVDTYIEDGILHIVLKDGTDLSAGEIKDIQSLVINESQHFIVTYNTGETADIGSLGDYSNVDFVSKTLKQTQANYVKDFSLGLGSALSGRATITQIFNRFQVINNRLSIIVNYCLSIGGTDVSLNTNIFMDESIVTIDPTVAAAIFDYNGVSVHQSAGSSTKITTTCAYINKGKGYNASLIKGAYLSLYNNVSANQMTVSIETKEPIVLENSTDYYVTARIYLDLL